MKQKPALVIAIIVMSVVMGTTYIIGQNHTESAAKAELRNQAERLTGQLEQSLNRRLQLARGLAAFVHTNPNFSASKFDRFADALAGNQDGVRSIQLAPNGIVTHMTNKAENARALGLNVFQDPARGGLAPAAAETKTFIISGPFELVQGGTAIVARLPIHLPDGDKAERFWGFASVLIDPSALFREAGILEASREMHLAIHGRNASGEVGKVFYGASNSFENLTLEIPVTLPTGSWFLGAGWKNGNGPTTASTHALTFAIGFALAAAAGACMFAILRRPEHLKDEIAKATAALQENQARFTDFAEASSDWFWETDEEHRYTWFSDHVENVTGVPPSWHYGKTRLELGAPNVVTPEWEAHMRTLNERKPFKNFDFIRPGPDGKKWLRASGVPVFNDAGQFKGYRGTGSDISAEMEARQFADRAKTQLGNAIEGLNELFALWDADDKLILCNERYRKFNAQIEESTRPGTLFADHIHALIDAGQILDIQGREEEWFEETLHKHHHPQASYEVHRQNGVWLLVNEQRFSDGSTVTVALDITNQKNHQFKLQESMENAEKANQAKSQFLANMSHELRTPLNAVIGMADALLTGVHGDIANKKQEDFLSDIKESGTHLMGIIEEILDVSRIEAGSVRFEESIFDAGTVIEDALRLVKQTRGMDKLSIPTTVSPNLPLVKGDPRMIKQCLLNLLYNAIKFTGRGGTIQVSTTICEGALSIDVSDSGCGIAENDIDLIFEPFQQVAAHETRTHGGTGLGLSIVKSFIELHDGDVSVRSTPGRGSTFTITFPAWRMVQPEQELACPEIAAL